MLVAIICRVWQEYSVQTPIADMTIFGPSPVRGFICVRLAAWSFASLTARPCNLAKNARSCLPNIWLRRYYLNYHAIIVEGGFNEEGTFVSIPFAGLQKMTEYFRRKVIWLFVEKELINEKFARNLLLLSRKHFGFSQDSWPSSSCRLPPGW